LVYDMGDQMALRSAGDMTIPQWASMGFWTRNQFGLLFALSARVQDFCIVAFWSDATNEMGIVVQIQEEVHVATERGTSKAKAKQAVAEKMIREADIWTWINSHHCNTAADEYLRSSE